MRNLRETDLTRAANGEERLFGLSSLIVIASSVLRRPYQSLISERTPTGTYYYLFDGLGSTVALTDSTGAVKNTYTYDPYGKVTSSTGLVANPYRFGGAYGAYTDSSGLLKIGQRYYDPSIGRWTQQDIVAGAFAKPMTLNRYTYVGCNPVNAIDPSGHY